MRDFPISTTTALAAAATFTSAWKRVRYIPAVTFTTVPQAFDWAEYIHGIAFSDVAGTLWIEHSNDGVTVHSQDAPLPVGAGLAGALAYNRPTYGVFVRLRYVNGAVAQATFSLSGILSGPQ